MPEVRARTGKQKQERRDERIFRGDRVNSCAPQRAAAQLEGARSAFTRDLDDVRVVILLMLYRRGDDVPHPQQTLPVPGASVPRSPSSAICLRRFSSVADATNLKHLFPPPCAIMRSRRKGDSSSDVVFRPQVREQGKRSGGVKAVGLLPPPNRCGRQTIVRNSSGSFVVNPS